MPSKPEKYGIKIFWVCDANNSYPLNGQIYTGKLSDGNRQTNVGECTVLDLVSKYKNSGLNVTTDNFFTSLQLAHSLNSWKFLKSLSLQLCRENIYRTKIKKFYGDFG